MTFIFIGWRRTKGHLVPSDRPLAKELTVRIGSIAPIEGNFRGLAVGAFRPRKKATESIAGFSDARILAQPRVTLFARRVELFAAREHLSGAAISRRPPGLNFFTSTRHRGGHVLRRFSFRLEHRAALAEGFSGSGGL